MHALAGLWPSDTYEGRRRDPQGELMWTGPLCPHNDECEQCGTVGMLHLCGYCANAWHFECLPPEHQAVVSGTYWKCQEGAAGSSAPSASSAAQKVGPKLEEIAHDRCYQGGARSRCLPSDASSPRTTLGTAIPASECYRRSCLRCTSCSMQCSSRHFIFL